MKKSKTCKFWKHSKPDNANVLSQFYMGTMLYRFRWKYPINSLESRILFKFESVEISFGSSILNDRISLDNVILGLCSSGLYLQIYKNVSNHVAELKVFNAGSKFVETLLSLDRRVDPIWPPFDSLSEGHQKIFKNTKTCFSKRNDKLTKYRCFALHYYCNMDVANTIHLWGRTQIRTDLWTELIG